AAAADQGQVHHHELRVLGRERGHGVVLVGGLDDAHAVAFQGDREGGGQVRVLLQQEYAGGGDLLGGQGSEEGGGVGAAACGRGHRGGGDGAEPGGDEQRDAG